MDADLDRLAQSAHAAYLAEPGDRHAPERCANRLGVCLRCDNLLRPWPDLAESDREAFARQMRPALAVLGEVRDEMRARLPARDAERQACAAILDAVVARHRADSPHHAQPGAWCEDFGCSSLMDLAAAIRARGEPGEAGERDDWRARADAMLAATRNALAQAVREGSTPAWVGGASEVAAAVELAYAKEGK